MKRSEARIGMRVRRSSDASSFVRDNNSSFLRGRRIGIITSIQTSGFPFATIRWEGSHLEELCALHRLQPVSTDDTSTLEAGSDPR